MLICKGQKMSNFIFFIIVALYIYYNKSDEDCKGQKLSVSILVSRLGQIVIVFPVLICSTFTNVRLVLSLLPSIIVIMSMTTQSSSYSLRHKSPIFIVQLACSNIIYHRCKYCKGQIMSVLVFRLPFSNRFPCSVSHLVGLAR